MIKSKHIMITDSEDKNARIFKIIRKDQGPNDNSYTMVRSSLDPGWSNPNKIIGGLMDRGSDVAILIGDQSMALDYDEAEELYLILREYLKDLDRPTEIRTIGKKEKI